MLNNKYKKEKMAFCITFILGLITHFAIFCTESLAPDALVTGNYKIAGNWEMSLGRWGIVFFDSIRGGIVNEVIIIVFCLIFLGLSSALVCKMLNIENKFAIAIVSGIFATAPQFSETFMFIYCADSYCFSVLAATASAYFILKNDKKKYNIILSILFGIISLSIYQAYIAITVVLVLISYINKVLINKLNNKELIIKLFRNFIIILLSMICYLIITKIILAINGLEFASYKGANSFSISNIISNLPNTIKNSYCVTNDFLFNDNILRNFFWHRNIYNILICILNFCFIFFVIIKNKVYKNKVSFAILLSLIIIIPIGINIICIIMPDTVTNIVTGPALILIYVMFLSIIENNNLNISLNRKIYNFTRIGTLGLLTVLIFTYIMSNNATYMARQEIYINYYSIQNDILQKVHNLDGYNEEKKWIFTDNLRYKSKFAEMSNGTIADDYETWDNIDGIWANYQFYDRYLGQKIKMATKEEYYEIVGSDEVTKMEAYPSKNCVKIIGDFIVIKIGDSNYKK